MGEVPFVASFCKNGVTDRSLTVDENLCKEQRTATPIVLIFADEVAYQSLYMTARDDTRTRLETWWEETKAGIRANRYFDDRARQESRSGAVVGAMQALKAIVEDADSAKSLALGEEISRRVLASYRRLNLPVQVGELADKAKICRRTTQDWLRGRPVGAVAESRLTAVYEAEREKLFASSPVRPHAGSTNASD